MSCDDNGTPDIDWQTVVPSKLNKEAARQSNALVLSDGKVMPFELDDCCAKASFNVVA
jgi:hypothetical protein